MNLKSIEEQLNIAKESKNEDELSTLSQSRDMNVRRAVARNANTSIVTANILAFDPVLNVSYMASKNPKCTNSRNFSNIHISECVICQKDERYLDCSACEDKLINF